MASPDDIRRMRVQRLADSANNANSSVSSPASKTVEKSADTLNSHQSVISQVSQGSSSVSMDVDTPARNVSATNETTAARVNNDASISVGSSKPEISGRKSTSSGDYEMRDVQPVETKSQADRISDWLSYVINKPGLKVVDESLGKVQQLVEDELYDWLYSPSNKVRSQTSVSFLLDCYFRAAESNRNDSQLASDVRRTIVRVLLTVCRMCNGNINASATVSDQQSLTVPKAFDRNLVSRIISAPFYSDFLREVVQEAHSTLSAKEFDSLLLRDFGATLIDIVNINSADAHSVIFSALRALTELCIVQVDAPLSNSVSKRAIRPFCDSLVASGRWLPDPERICDPDSVGMEPAELSWLGALFRNGSLPDDSRRVDETLRKHVRFPMPVDDLRTLAFELRSMLGPFRSDLHTFVHDALILYAPARDRLLRFLVETVRRNTKRSHSMMYAHEFQFASDSFMFNWLAVLEREVRRVQIDKVDTLYPYRSFAGEQGSKALLTRDPNVTRLNCTQPEFEAFLADCPSQLGTPNGPPKFGTEILFITIELVHLGIGVTLQNYKSRARRVQDFEEDIKKLEAEIANEQAKKGQDPASASASASTSTNTATPAANPAPSKKERQLARWKEQLDSLKRSRLAYDIMLCDESLIQHAFGLYSAVAQLLLSTFNQQVQLPAAKNSPDLPNTSRTVCYTTVLPEFYVEDIANIWLYYVLQALNREILLSVDPVCMQILLEFIVTMLCRKSHVKNPYVTAKFVEILFHLTPLVNPRYGVLFNSMLGSSSNAQRVALNENLIGKLIEFWIDVEMTGAHTEFFDKFNIRYHLSFIFKSVWTHLPAFKYQFLECAAGTSRSGNTDSAKQFVKFVNLFINDTTFMLDESLSALKRIHDTQELLANTVEWQALGDEQREAKLSKLEQDERVARSYLQQSNVELDMLDYLTKEIQAPFLVPELADRLACMLNFNLVQLCGSRCRDLKVREPAKYGWEPRKLLDLITNIYLNLGAVNSFAFAASNSQGAGEMSGTGDVAESENGSDSERFARAVARDERSYKEQLFIDAIAILTRLNLKTSIEREQLERFAERVAAFAREQNQADEDYDDVPNEFLDPIMSTLMQDPVTLSTSGHTVDRSVIVRHLLSDPRDPFNRKPLTESDLVPATELRNRIREWKRQKDAENAAKRHKHA